MLKSFRQMIEQSIHLGSGKKPVSRHSTTHKREPHISHSLKTGPTGEYDRPKKKLNELLGTLAAGAVGGALAYRAVTKKGGVVDRVQKERQRKEHLKSSIKSSEERTKALKDKLRKSSVIKAALNMREDTRKLSTAERFAKNLKKGGFDLAAHEKRNKELADKNAELQAKYAHLLKKEEAPAVSVAGGAVPSITDPTTNYALQLKKKVNMLRRKKPQ